MAGLKALTLAGAAVLAVMSGASAADLLPPPPARAASAADCEFSGWYLRGDIGIGVEPRTTRTSRTIRTRCSAPTPAACPISSATTAEFNNTTLSESGMFDVGVGYQFNHWLRGDLTLEYRGGASLQSLYTINDPMSADHAI